MRGPSTRLGEIIRRQREFNRMTLRQFATLAGISNPYLSQIERGLRAPSDDVVRSIADALKINLDKLYEEAGLTRDVAHDADESGRARLTTVLDADPALSPRQRRVLLEVYDGLAASTPTPRRRTTPNSPAS